MSLAARDVAPPTLSYPRYLDKHKVSISQKGLYQTTTATFVLHDSSIDHLLLYIITNDDSLALVAELAFRS